MTLSLVVNNSVILDAIARLSKNKKLNACIYTNSSTPSNNTALWHYLGTKQWDFRCENNNTPRVFIEEIQYVTYSQV